MSRNLAIRHENIVDRNDYSSCKVGVINLCGRSGHNWSSQRQCVERNDSIGIDLYKELL